MVISEGDIVEVLPCGDAQKDVMYRGWHAIVCTIRNGRAYIDSDQYVRYTGNMQAVSFRNWFPISGLKRIAAPPQSSATATPGEGG